MYNRSGRLTPVAARVNKLPAVILFLAVALFVAADLLMGFDFNWIDYTLVIVIFLSGLRGYFKGFINTLFSLGGYILGIICAYLFSPKLALITMQKTSIGTFIGEKINEFVPALSTVSAINVSDASSTLEIINKHPNFSEVISSNAVLEQIMSITDKAAETGSMYSETVVTVNDLVVFSILKILALVVLFFVIKLLVVIIGRLLTSVFDSSAILGTANRCGGMAIGLAIGLLICYVVFVFAIPTLGSLGIVQVSEKYTSSILLTWLNTFVQKL